MVRPKKAKLAERQMLARRPDYEAALETLDRFAKMMGGELTKSSGILRQSTQGQWQGSPASYPPELFYPSLGHGAAK